MAPRELPIATTITPEETPTAQIIRESNPVHTVTDSLGRKIRYKNLSILQRARMARSLGADAGNAIYFGMLATAAAVIDIDGDMGPQGMKPSFLEGRLDWLGDAGWDAIIADDQARANQGDELARLSEAKN